MDIKVAVMNAYTQNRKLMLYAAGVGLASLALIFGVKYFKKQKKVTRVGVVSNLVIHPVKSGKGLPVTTAECLEMGLKHGELKDRHWLVVTEEGQQVTARQEPRLVLMLMVSEGGHLCLNAPGMEELRIPPQQPGNPIVNCRVWSVDIQGRDCGEQASLWITKYLASDKPLHLVHFEPQMKARRPMEKEPLFSPQDKVAYPDAAAILLLSENSVADLNTRLEREVSTGWFRPSIVVSGCDAFAEDSWDEIQIGNVTLNRVMACGRCILTTVDPETGIIDRKQPLDTLKSYRMCKPSEKQIYKAAPLFGQYYSVKKTGILQVGDPVYKISY